MLELRPDGSALLGATLFAADLHLGKDASFRQKGVAVPAGSTEETLQKLSAAIDQSGASRVVLLGDLWHAASSLTDEVAASLLQWRGRHQSVEAVLIRGNHDRGGDDLMEMLAISEMEAGSRLGDVVLLHHPPEEPLGAPWLAGHIHPAWKLESGRRTQRVPCFWETLGGVVLPAFGAFTGTAIVCPRPGDSVHLLAGTKVIRVPV